MFTTTIKHALRALVVLSRLEPDGVMLGRDLAAAANVPQNYLYKILLDLQRGGFVVATRGTGGGYRLAVPASEIHLIEVVEIFAGTRARPTCLLECDRLCSDDSPCSAHVAWRGIRQQIVEFLETTTLAGIALHGGVGVLLCGGKKRHGEADRRESKTRTD